jgi:large subunit ribosomal protein L3
LTINDSDYINYKKLTMKKGWIILIKKEMTKMWLETNFTSVTILEFPEQQLLRIKSKESDGYEAAVVSSKSGKNSKLFEFRLDEGNNLGSEAGEISAGVLEGVELVSFTGTSKGKGYAGGIKRYGLRGMPATHGHKFTRHLGSKGNRKPRRTQKGHPHAGHMGMETVTVKNIKIVNTFDHEGKHFVVVKWSIPGRYNGMLKCYFQ